MKKILLAALVLCTIQTICQGQESSEIARPPDSDNEKAEISQWIGPVKVTVDYHSPRVHLHGAERTGHIWGELIPYGFFDDGNGPSKAQPWRAGSNETTTITFSHDVKIDGKDLPAETYGLFLALDKDKSWTWIFSRHYGWGAYQYDPKDDVLRVSAAPHDATFTEFLSYGFEDRLPDSATAFLQWENKHVAFKIDVPNVNEIYVSIMRQQLQSYPGFNYRSWQTAAQFCADHKVALEEGLVWADKAIKEPFRGGSLGKEDFSTLQTKSAVLQAMGRDKESDAVMDQALHLPGADVIPVHQYAMKLLRAGQKEKAMEIFQLNAQRHPEEPFYVHAGLARGYTALGDKARAIENWETALKNVPDTQKGNLPVYEKALQDLRDGK